MNPLLLGAGGVSCPLRTDCWYWDVAHLTSRSFLGTCSIGWLLVAKVFAPLGTRSQSGWEAGDVSKQVSVGKLNCEEKSSDPIKLLLQFSSRTKIHYRSA